jgi:hypothetical protein
MINSTTSTDRAVHAEAVAKSGQVTVRGLANKPDQLSTEHATYLREALARQPEIRPEVVERGRSLASDPNYPTVETLKQIGAMILNAPDLSTDAS